MNKKKTTIYQEFKKTKSIRDMEKAIELIEEARELINDVLSEHLEPFNIASHYYAYGEYGISQLLGKGNPNDGKLQDIINKLKEEAL